MSEKAEKKPEAPAAPADEAGKKPKGGGVVGKTPVLVGGVMLLEAIVLIGGFKFLGGGSPKKAGAAETIGATLEGGKEGGADAADAKKHPVEIPIVDFRAPNKRSGHTYLYDIAIVAVVKAPAAEQIKKLAAERDNLIRDRIRTIIAESDPEKLSGGTEPGLETLRRQIKYQLNEILGDGAIDEVLVPKCTSLPVDF
ncbi:MAG TPA: flagellar basal body-associated FliL family protein [Tepidisphaeraceae bacterium]|nr:flagellar basal body-associated FliL family protein [Tepidisphaeraceae bacterium]